jgi:thiol-disulfide isomerase/thioredoxin
MKKFIHISVVCALCIFTNYSTAQDIKCKLKGTIIGRDSKALILVTKPEDFRFGGIRIPIIDNKFEYELNAKVIEKYILMFEDECIKGIIKPIFFFPENCTVEFTLYSFDENDKNVVSGGKVNKEMIDFENRKKEIFDPLNKPINAKFDSLYKFDLFYSEKSKILNEKFKNAKNDSARILLTQEHYRLLENKEAYSNETLQTQEKSDSIYRLMNNWQNEYIKSNQDIFSYSLLLSSLQVYSKTKNKDLVDINFIREIFPVFSERFPYHPYTYQMGDIFTAINTINVGGHYIDFTAPTIDGRMVKLSDEINGKVALIDLWASWCRPCRASGINMIPVYEKYKDKGFVIVGVACEFKNTNAFKVALENDKYPWLNLIELDNKNGIWNKYNISGAGGCKYLVDTNGNILAVNPDNDLLESFLSRLLK